MPPREEVAEEEGLQPGNIWVNAPMAAGGRKRTEAVMSHQGQWETRDLNWGITHNDGPTNRNLLNVVSKHLC